VEDRVISKRNFRDWLGELAREFALVGPVKQEEGPIAFQEVTPDTDLVLDNKCWEMPPKDYLLPRCETLFVFDTKKGEESVQSEVPEAKRTMLIGLRPCDLRSLAVLDAVYLEGQFRDPYYAARRSNTVTMAYVCESKRWSCFCSTVGDPIEWVRAADLALTDIGDSYVVTAFEDGSSSYLKSDLLAKPTKEQLAERDKVWERLSETSERFDPDKVAEAVDWEEAEWDKIAQKCLGCGICTFICPTCTCFDIQDEALGGGKAERFRVRDTCQFCHFTKMGAGHNPRPGKKERARQRVSHKFKYTVETCGILSCTGCGRCIELCPVNIDIHRVITEVAKSEDREPAAA